MLTGATEVIVWCEVLFVSWRLEILLRWNGSHPTCIASLLWQNVVPSSWFWESGPCRQRQRKKDGEGCLQESRNYTIFIVFQQGSQITAAAFRSLGAGI